ncbi:hypothetical protein EGS38_02140 [Neisseria chenwenguii]|nr:hypothetical protein EGS38_02140 [Neisseria chenwenguii]
MGDFMRSNLLNILITLMAINTATVAVILSKLYEISKQHNQKINDSFKKYKSTIIIIRTRTSYFNWCCFNFIYSFKEE